MSLLLLFRGVSVPPPVLPPASATFAWIAGPTAALHMAVPSASLALVGRPAATLMEEE